MKYNTVKVEHGDSAQTFRRAIHVIDNGVHIITEENGSIVCFPLNSIVTCFSPIEEDKGEDLDLDLDEVIDAGNAMYKLVTETRDSIYESNVIAGTDEFPDTPDGKSGREWYEEYRDAAREWYRTVSL